MVTGIHPDEIDLFDYVEGDLPTARVAELEVHLASCGKCAEQVARVRAGHEALREAQFLQLPPRRREGIFLNLPEQRRARTRSPALSPKRLLAILTPIAAVGAVVAALVTTNGGMGNEQAGATGGGGEARASADQAESGAAGAVTAPFRTVQGPAFAVAADLRAKGFDARVVGGRVEVRDATRKAVKTALSSRRAGRVKVIVLP
jgi:anti-sigma factor RsiW